MSERNRYEPGVPCWVHTMQPDPEAAAAFYGGLFGWQLEDPGVGYFEARMRGRVVAAVTPLPPGLTPAPPPDWVTSVFVASVHETADRVRAAGGRVLAEPFDGPAGPLTVIADPAGGVLAAWQPDGTIGAELVNEPGAWSMSRLDTPDTQAAGDFYGAVFGWTSEPFEMDGARFTLFRLPGYVGGEPEQPVSREVVAVMAPADAGTAHWSVDFWVHDVDEAAGRARELGGSLVAGPFDVTGGRMAVLADPAGVSFSVTRMAAAAG